MNFETTARPYAQAIYEHSQGWEKDLNQLELALETPEVQHLIDSPKLAYKEKTQIFLSLFEGQIESKTSNLVKVLGESKRISLIPHIFSEYRSISVVRNSHMGPPFFLSSKIDNHISPA